MQYNRSQKISVIIPVYNSELYIEESVESVLGQTENDFEIIIVNDGSTDSTSEILKKYKNKINIKILEHPNKENRGVSSSRMLGVSHSNAEYIAFLDADDKFRRDKLEVQLKYLQNNSNCVLCHTAVKPLGPNSEIFFSAFHIFNDSKIYNYKKRPKYLIENNICNSTTLIQSKFLKGLNFQIDQLFQYEDWLLWIMLAQSGKFLYIPEMLTYYRYHENSATSKILRKPILDIYSKIELYVNLFKKPVEMKTKFLSFIYMVIQFKRLFKNYHRY